MTTQPLDHLKTLLGEVSDLRSASAVLGWDQETYMPPAAGEARARQTATLERIAHERFTSDAIGQLLDDLEETELSETDNALIRVTRRDYDRATRLPADLVAELALASGRAKEAWKTAREQAAFATFAPHLARLIELNIQKAEAIGYDENRYDALLDEYEPGMKTAHVATLFADLRSDLVPLVQAIMAQPQPEDGVLHQVFDPRQQWAFGMDVLKDIGYNFDRGRQDLSAHPFTTSFSISDVRITTRVQEHFFSSAFFGTLHEAGHALYEQGIDPSLERTPLADGTSLGMHESQSRLWENQVGRSRWFWQYYFSKLRETFPDALAQVNLETFYRAINRVEPSRIRVEADEVTYNLHIMLRFELETALLDEQISVDEVPEQWNAKMQDYLGLTPANDAEGCLQDIHWSLGAFGYFPTYTLGNLMSAQLFDQARHDLGDLEAQISGGQFEPLLGWLRTHIHRHGRMIDAPELLHRVTGESLSAAPWLAYIRHKYVTPSVSADASTSPPMERF